MSLIFYYSPMSTAVVTHWALEELKVPYEKVRIDLKAGDSKKPSYLALNPNGMVPCLVHDGTPIFESIAIALHLGETFGVEKKLFPAPGIDRAVAFKWLVWSGVTVASAFQRFVQSSSDRVPAERHNAMAAEAAKSEVEKHFAVLDAELANKPYMLGTSFSLVDVQLAGFVGWIGFSGFDLKRWPNIDAWVKRCSARPAHDIAMAPE